MKVELIDYTEGGIYRIARMARATRKNKIEDHVEVWAPKEDKLRWIEKNEKFVKGLLKIGHLGVLEHITFTFHISEISRCLTHQLVRHRLASYLQMSNRHTKPNSKDYVEPPLIKNTGKKTPEEASGKETVLYDTYTVALASAYDMYERLIKHGLPIEDARYILPPAFYTHISVTMNARTLRHFFELRCDKSAQWEIRHLAKEMLRICCEKYPIIFEDLYEKYMADEE